MMSKCVCLVIAFCLAASNLSAQALNDAFESLQRKNAEGSLAVLGLVGIPDDAASSIFLQSGESNRNFDFRSAQLGGGFRVAETVPLYLEGYIGYSRYDPVLTFSNGDDVSKLPLKWTSVAATGGIGWEFDFAEYWTFRPMAHLSIGRTQGDGSVGAQLIANELGFDRDFLESGGIWAGGYGASAALAYDRSWANNHQLEVQLRANYLEYQPIWEDSDLLASSTSANAVLWSRYRFPTKEKAFGRPVRGVTDLSISHLLGDQADILGTDWLARVGVGLEVDMSDTWVPWVTTTRLMVRYYGSDTVDGVTVGLGVSF